MKYLALLVVCFSLTGCAAYDASPNCVGSMPKCSPRPSNIFKGWQPEESPKNYYLPPPPGVTNYQQDAIVPIYYT